MKNKLDKLVDLAGRDLLSEGLYRVTLVVMKRVLLTLK